MAIKVTSEETINNFSPSISNFVVSIDPVNNLTLTKSIVEGVITFQLSAIVQWRLLSVYEATPRGDPWRSQHYVFDITALESVSNLYTLFYTKLKTDLGYTTTIDI